MRKKKHQQQDNRLSWILSLAGIMIVGLIILMQLSPGGDQHDSAEQARPHQDESYSAMTFLVSTQFNCSCGDCSDVVSDCTCPTGKATKDFIEQKVSEGYQKQAIIALVKDTFGHYRD